MKDYSIAAARDRLAALVHEAEEGKPVRLTRRGRPVVVVVAAAEYERLTQRRPSQYRAVMEFRKTVALDPGHAKALERPGRRSTRRKHRW